MRKVRFDETKFEEFLSKHDMIYEKPANEWERGIPLANGTVGTVIWGSNPLKVSMDRVDVWEIRSSFQPDPEQFKWRKFCERLEKGEGNNVVGFAQTEKGPFPSHIPAGRFEVSLEGQQIEDFQMHLKLYDAIAKGAIKTEKGSMEWHSYVSADEPVIIFHYKLSGDEHADIRFKFTAKVGDYDKECEVVIERRKASRKLGYRPGNGVEPFAKRLKEWGYEDPEISAEDNIETFLLNIPENGNFAIAWTSLSHSQNEKTLVVSLITDRENARAKEQAIQLTRKIAVKERLKLLEAGHKAWWHAYYPKSFLSLSETRLEALYWVEMYILGCTSRPGGCAPCLSGPWSHDTGFDCMCSNDYHWNINCQANIMPVYTANRLECGFPYYDMLEKNMDNMKKFCRDFFECDGAFLTHCTDLDCNPMYCNSDQFEMCSLPWMCFYFWEHYKYSMDEVFLKEKAYPLMRDAVKPMIHALRIGEDGKLHLPWTSSPEYHGIQETLRWGLLEDVKWEDRFSPDATIDLAFLRFLCEALLETVDILGVEDEDRMTWEHTLENLTPFVLDQFGGLMVGGELALESSHRHMSHLSPIYPLHQLTYDTEKDKEIIDWSIFAECLYGTGEWMGWSYTHMATVCLLSGRPEIARNLLLEFLNQMLYENAFYMQGCREYVGFNFHNCTGPSIDAPLMSASTIMDFVCRSFNGVIYVFDGMPEAWYDVAFWSLRAEGAFLLSAKRKDAVTEFISVYAEKGGTVRLVSDMGTDVKVICNEEEVAYAICGNKIVFETCAEQEYLILRKDAEPEEYFIEPVEDKAYERHFFGLKKKPSLR